MSQTPAFDSYYVRFRPLRPEDEDPRDPHTHPDFSDALSTAVIRRDLLICFLVVLFFSLFYYVYFTWYRMIHLPDNRPPETYP